MLKVVREVFSERNIVVLSGTSCLYQVFNSLWRLWWSLYLLDVMGAPIAVVGLLSTIQSSSRILFQLPGGVLADRIGRKKVIVLGTVLRMIGPFILFLAPTWQSRPSTCPPSTPSSPTPSPTRGGGRPSGPTGW
jgi:MFS family permease